jgi:hypothetical protein
MARKLKPELIRAPAGSSMAAHYDGGPDATNGRVCRPSQHVLCHHHERMKCLSQGLRGTSYLGCAMGWDVNPERVASSVPGVTGHCPRRADILSALDATQPLSGSYEHWTPKADRMSARRSFGRDGGGRARMRPSVPRTVVNPTARRRERLGRGSEATLTGLGVLTMVEPRVARASQPWAEGCNPFGIDQDVRTSRTCSRRRKSALISVTAQECADCRRRLQCRGRIRTLPPRFALGTRSERGCPPAAAAPVTQCCPKFRDATPCGRAAAGDSRAPGVVLRCAPMPWLVYRSVAFQLLID